MHDAPLCLLQVHAHPDDEASKGAGTTAKYAAQGVRNVLVCCTGGEEGDILNPAMDRPEIRERLPEVRMEELAESCRILGYDACHLLGYRDSGMPETEANARPDNFWNAPLDEAVERFVRVIRAERPQVIITYHEDREWYPHPDHIRVFEISEPAFTLAGDPDAFPDAGPPWQPVKLYYVAWSFARVRALHQAHLDRGLESPFERWFESRFPDRDDRFTTRIEIGDFMQRRRDALLAHATQVAPDGFWMKLPDDILRDVYPWEDYILARSLVDTPAPALAPRGPALAPRGPALAPRGYESDLFAGVREPAERGS